MAHHDVTSSPSDPLAGPYNDFDYSDDDGVLAPQWRSEDEISDYEDEVYSTPRQMFFLLLRVSMGPAGTLAIPWAFARGGLVTAPVVTMLVMLLITYNITVLVKSADVLEKQGLKSNSYAACAEHAGGVYASKLVQLFLVLLQLGVCTVQISFASDCFFKVVPSVDKRLLTTMLMPALIWLTLINDISRLSPFAVIGSLGVCVSVLAIVGLCISKLANSGSPLTSPSMPSWGTFPIFIGVVFYSCESIGCTMAFRRSMGPRKSKFIGLSMLVMTVTTLSFVLLGTMGYLTFGDVIEANAVGFLAKTNKGFIGLDILLLVSAVVGYPMQLAPVVHMLVDRLRLNKRDHGTGIVAIRLLFLCFNFGLALAIPHLGVLTSFVGASCGSMLSVVFPVLIDLQVRKNHHSDGDRRMQVLAAMVSVIIGMAVALSGTWTSLQLIFGPAAVELVERIATNNGTAVT